MELAPRDAALLAWLALEGPTPRERLLSLLWPEATPKSGRNNLRQRLFRLKRLCGAELVVGNNILALDTSVTHDLDRSHTLLGEDDHDHSAEFAAWLRDQRARRQVRWRQILVDRAEDAERAQAIGDALLIAMDILHLEPLSEEAHRRLIRLHYLAGDRTAALLAFDHCERVLKDEVGARPSEETLALLATIERAQEGPRHVATVPPAVLRPPELVGRTRELQDALTAWERGLVVSVTGEAGLGKTRLLQELARRHGRAVIAQARPGDRMSPYAAVCRMLRAICAQVPASAQQMPEIASAPTLIEWAGSVSTEVLPNLPPTQHQPRIRHAVVKTMRSAHEHGIDALLLDDLHFADEATLELLQELVRPDGSAPLTSLRIAIAQRPAEGGAGLRALHEALLEDHALAPIHLKPFDASQVCELIDSLALGVADTQKLAAGIFRMTGGNPLFALETVRQAVVESRLDVRLLPRPASVGLVIEGRLQRLSSQALQLARCASVAGQDFTPEMASKVLGVRALDLADAWAELDAAQILLGGAFTHDLIHDAVRASVPEPIAQSLHAEIAQHLCLQGAPASRVAEHWEKAKRWALAGPAFLRAAEDAQKAGRSMERADLLALAADCFQRAGDGSSRFDALLERADALTLVERGDILLAGVHAVESVAENELQRLRALLVRVQASDLRGDVAVVLDKAPTGVELAKAQGRADMAVSFEVLLARALAELRRAPEAVARLELQIGWIREQGDSELTWSFWMALAHSLDYANRLGDAVPAWKNGLDIAERLHRPDLSWMSLQDLSATQAKMGRLHLAVELGERAERLADSLGEMSRGRRMEAQMALAQRLRDVGRYAEAVGMLEEALVFFSEDGRPDYLIASIEYRLAQSFQHLGQHARCHRLLAADYPGLVAPGVKVLRLLLRSELARQVGGDSASPLQQAYALIPDRNDIYNRIAQLFESSLAPPEQGEPLATGVAAWASAHQRHGLALAAHVRAASSALAQGSAARALPHVEAALRLSRDYTPEYFYLPEMWLVAGRVFIALHSPAEAAMTLNEGASWVRRVNETCVAAEFRHSFLNHNAINRELLALAARHTA